MFIFNLTPYQPSLLADSNLPQNMGNGWWNNTIGANWLINTTDNFWHDKNISVSDSIILQNGGNLTLQNCTVIINGNLTVGYNASLTLINTTIRFNVSYNGSSSFSLETGGSLDIKDYDLDPNTKMDATNITINKTEYNHRFTFFISKQTNFSMINSELHYCGYSESPNYYGLYLMSNNCTIENNTFSNNYAGLIIESSNNTIKNNIILNNDEYGILVVFSTGNLLLNNSIICNKFNFGYLIDHINQSNVISISNTINGKPIYYQKSASDLIINSGFINASFLGLVDCDNITIIDQSLKRNFNSVLLFSINNTQFENVSLIDNNYAFICENVHNFTMSNCTISNNEFIGIEFIDSCDQFYINNCSFYNNSISLRISDSNVTLINSTFKNCSESEIYVKGDSNVFALNCSLNNSLVKIISVNSIMLSKYFLNVQTMNHTGIPIGNVPLEIYDGNGNLVLKNKTNSAGYLNRIACTGYEVTKNGLDTTMANHRIIANYSNMSFIAVTNMTSSKEVVLYLNHAPEIINKTSDIIYIFEDSKFIHDFESFDIDSDNITWGYTTNASWLNPINATTGKVNGTPLNSDVGYYFLNVSCSDNYFGSDSYNLTIIVNNTNDKPSIISKTGAENAHEDSPYIHDFDVFDPDVGDVHTWYMTTNASWIFPIHKSLGRIFGYPYQRHIGRYFVNISVIDVEGLLDYYNYTLVVFPTNDAPIILNTSSNLIKVKEDDQFYMNFDYSDPDKNAVVWVCYSNATWLDNINYTTGVLTGIPTNKDVGTYFVNVSCLDPEYASDYFNFTLKVINTNDPPKFYTEYPKELFAIQNKYFDYTFRVTDPDKNDDFDFSLSTIFIDGIIDSTKAKDDNNGSRTGTGDSNSDSNDNINLNTNVNTKSNRDSNTHGNTHGNMNCTTSIRSGSDEMQWLGFYVDQVDRSCTIFGIPDNDAVGKLIVNMSVTDIGLEVDNISFEIVIRNVNDRPVITNREQDIVFLLEDIEYFKDFEFIDIDGDEVSWSMNTNANWLSEISANTGIISGIPTQKDVDVKYQVEIICADPFGGIDSQNFTIIINNTNDPPVITNPSLATVYIFENEFYTYDFDSIDLDSKDVFWSSYTNANWLNDINLYTGIINGTPGDYDVGEYYVNITCYDDKLNLSFWNYTIIVKNTNDPPKIINALRAPVAVDIDKRYYFKFKYKDIDDDVITWHIITNASWLSFNNETAELSGTPVRLDIGRYHVNITCRDINGAIDFYDYNLRVKGIYNRPPELMEGHVEPKYGTNNTLFTFFVNYRDVDGDDPFAVIVKIDETPYHMLKMSDTNITEGRIYKFSIKLNQGNHTFYFQALDQLYRNAVVYDFTPTYSNPGLINVKAQDEKGSTDEGWTQLWYLVIIIIIIELIIGLVIRKRRQIRKLRERRTEELVEKYSSTKPKIKTKSGKLTTQRTRRRKKREITSATLPLKKADQSLSTPGKEHVDETLELKESSDDTGLDTEDMKSHELMVCPECGEFVNETYSSCPSCGVKFVYDNDMDKTEIDLEGTMADEIEPQDEIPDTNEPGPGLGLLICPECGEFVNETYDSCPGCGVRFVFDNEVYDTDEEPTTMDTMNAMDTMEPHENVEAHEIMVCPECGVFVNETYSSCPGCDVAFVFDDSSSSEKTRADSVDAKITDLDDKQKMNKPLKKKKRKPGSVKEPGKESKSNKRVKLKTVIKKQAPKKRIKLKNE